MSRVFWDTNLFIYLFEGYGEFSKQVVTLRERMLARGDQLFSSSLTLGEILVKPIERRDSVLTAKYQSVLQATATLIPFDIPAAAIYAQLRSDRSLRAPDAIQLACAAAAKIDLFITNDARLSSRQIPGIQFIVSLDRAPI